MTDEIARRFTPPESPAEAESASQEPAEEGQSAGEHEAGMHKQAPLIYHEAVQRIDSVLGINERAAEAHSCRNRRADEAVSFDQTLRLLGRRLSWQ